MAFDYNLIGRVSVTLNSEFTVNAAGDHIPQGPRIIWSYDNPADSLAQISAPTYFQQDPFINEACSGDLIYVAGSDGVKFLYVDTVNSFTNTLTTIAGPGAGGVTFTGVPPVTDGEVAVFDGTTGNAIRGGGVTLGPAAPLPDVPRKKAADAVVYLKGIEGIEFGDLHGYITLSDGLDQFGIASVHMDELNAERTVLISDNASLPTTPSAILELNTTKGTFLNSRLTTTQRDNLTTVVDGMEFFNTTVAAKQLRSGSTWKTQVHEVLSAEDGSVAAITTGGSVQVKLPIRPLIAQGYYDVPRIFVNDLGIIEEVALSTNVVRSLSDPDNIFPFSFFSQPTPGNYKVDIPSLSNTFYFSFSTTNGGAGQTIPFLGPTIPTYFAINSTNYNTFVLANPQAWLINNPGASGPQTIVIPSPVGVNRAYYEVEIQLVIDAQGLPAAGTNYGDLSIGIGWPSVTRGLYYDFFHQGSETGGSGTTRYKAITKGLFTQSGGGNPIDDLYISFPIRNIGGPTDWLIANGVISIKRVLTNA